jgi:hypothetical protein
LQTFAQLGRAPARPESENCLTKVEAHFVPVGSTGVKKSDPTGAGN